MITFTRWLCLNRVGTIGRVATAVAVSAVLYFAVNHFLSRRSNEIASCANTREIQTLRDRVEKTTNVTSPYSVTIPLLAAAYMHDAPGFKKWREAIVRAFGINNEDSVESIVETLQGKASENAWILGRLLIANLRMEDLVSAQKIASVMEGLLEETLVDPFSSWAFGYLAIFYAQTKLSQYDSVKERMLGTIDELMLQPNEQGKDNVLWALVMALQSLAETGDRTGYETCIQKMMRFSGTSSIVAALRSIPGEDFRAWATSLTLNAANEIHDVSRARDLTAYLPTAIMTSTSDGDKMLAQLVECSMK